MYGRPRNGTKQTHTLPVLSSVTYPLEEYSKLWPVCGLCPCFAQPGFGGSSPLTKLFHGPRVLRPSVLALVNLVHQGVVFPLRKPCIRSSSTA